MRTAEIPLKKDLIITINEFLKVGSVPKNLRWWRTEINKLKKMENSSDPYEKSLAINTIDYLCSYIYETGKECIIKGRNDLAIKIYSLGIIIFPESKYFYEKLTLVRSYGEDYEIFQANSSNCCHILSSHYLSIPACFPGKKS